MGYTNRDQEREVRAALRAVNRLVRQVDTKGEVLERKMKYFRGRKTTPTREQLEAVIPVYDAYKAAFAALEKGLSDLMTIAAY